MLEPQTTNDPQLQEGFHHRECQSREGHAERRVEVPHLVRRAKSAVAEHGNVGDEGRRREITIALMQFIKLVMPNPPVHSKFKGKVSLIQ